LKSQQERKGNKRA